MKNSKEKEIGVNMKLDLYLASLRALTSWAEKENERLEQEIDQLDDNNYELEVEIKDVSKKLEDYVLLENLDDDRPGDAIRQDIDELDIKLNRIDNMLANNNYTDNCIQREESLKRDNLYLHQNSKKNTMAFNQLRENMNILKETLDDMGIRE